MNDNIVLCPAGTPGGQPTEVNFGHWADLETRIGEIATVTPTKAPELLATFNRVCLDLERLHNNLELEHQYSLRHAERVRGQVILDRVPKILIEKGIATAKNPLGSEDIRNAILSQDQEYQDALERCDQIRAMVKLISSKYDAFERAFRSVSKLVGEAVFNYGSNRSLSGDTGSAEPGEKQPPPGFGRPKR